jgi:hypothetical protein
MMTLRQLATEPPTLPTRTTWYLTDLAEARGKQELFTCQSPQKLKVLREHALIESAISSSRIEGVEVDKSRVATRRKDRGGAGGGWPPNQHVPRRGFAGRMSRRRSRLDPADFGQAAKGHKSQGPGHRPKCEMGKTGKLGISP